jgi:uncharacterized protein YndB with AHSA1/START domain
VGGTLLAVPHHVDLTHTYPVTPERVFTAWTDAATMRSWCCPDDEMTVSTCTIDARVGGGYHVVFGPGPDGNGYTETATYRELEPARRLVMELVLHGGGMDERSVATLTFTPDGAGTRLHLRNEGLSSAEVARLHTQGWTHSLATIAAVVATE